jgi:hypothetical protein
MTRERNFIPNLLLEELCLGDDMFDKIMLSGTQGQLLKKAGVGGVAENDRDDFGVGAPGRHTTKAGLAAPGFARTLFARVLRLRHASDYVVLSANCAWLAWL